MFEAIEGLVKLADKVGMLIVNKPPWLLHVDILKKVAMKKGIGDVQLSYGLVKLNRQSENNTDGSRLDYWTEGLSIINAILLIKSFGN